MITVLFVSSFKLDRIKLLAEHLLPLGVELTLLDISKNRNPVFVISEILKRSRTTILMTHESMMVPICFFLASFLGYRYIYIQNGVLWQVWNDFSKMQKVVRHKAFRMLLDRAMWIVTNSNSLKNELKAYHRGIQSKLVCIHNAIDFPEPSPHPFNFASGKNHFVTITNFEFPLKFEGVLYLLRALNEAGIPNVEFHVLSKVLTPYGERNQKSFHQRIIQESKIEGLHFYTNTNVAQFMQPAATFLYCSLPGGDSFPRAVVEALSLGIPSVIVDTNGSTEAIVHPDMALAVPLHIPSIVEGIRKVFYDPEIRITMSTISQREVKRNFTWEQMAREYAGLCRDMQGNC